MRDHLPMSLAGKRALVTGGSGNIGGAICRTLAAAGADVIVHGNRQAERAVATAGEIADAGGSAIPLAFDIRDGDAVKAALGSLSDGPAIQIVVHAAGRPDDAPLAGMTRAQWSGPIDISLNGFFNVIQPLLLPMIRTRWGRVIAISSVSGMIGNRGQANYAAAKAGLHGAVKSLALEYASRGMTANVVAPGIIATPETNEAFPDDRIESLVPMQRAGKPQDVADLVGYLASDKAGYVTGQVIAVGGGLG
jgi:3-oxoacyl-[acyl-carrier protein] reductase